MQLNLEIENNRDHAFIGLNNRFSVHLQKSPSLMIEGRKVVRELDGSREIIYRVWNWTIHFTVPSKQAKWVGEEITD